MSNIIGKIFGTGAKDVIDSVAGVVDKFVTTKEEKELLKIELQKEVNRHFEAIQNNAIRELELTLSDKQSAREMFKANSSLQKIYAIVFLIAYVIMSGAMCWAIFHLDKLEAIPDWGIGFISTIWGAMSMKVGTVTDFLFGASMTPDKK